MIQRLNLPHNAQFYKLKNDRVLSNAAINLIISAACKNRGGRYIVGSDYTRKEEVYNSANGTESINYKYTLRIFPSKKNVVFLKGVDLEDIIHAYILILEFNNNVVIFKKSTATFTKELLKYLEPLSHESILNILDGEKAKIQRLSLRNMTISGSAIHSHSYETSSDLKGLLSSHAMGKSIPKSIRFKEENTTKSVTASTSRILESSTKSGIEDLLIWSKNQIGVIESVTNNYFVDRFAKPVELSDILQTISPRAILIEKYDMQNLLDENQLQLGIKRGDRFRLFNETLVTTILDALDETFEIRTNDLICHMIDEECIEIGKLKINDKSITFSISALQRVYVKVNGIVLSLQQYIINNKYYSIVFDDIKYMYFMGQCFEDASGISEITTILDMLVVKTELNTVSTEKGGITTTQTSFDATSMFSVVEAIHASDDYIFCDDLGNEWCDHITLNIDEKTISFIHSKAKGESLSASNLHDVVSQGIKNLGNMFFTKKDFENTKKSKFQNFYKRANTTSAIPRIRKGGVEDDDLRQIDSIINDHKTHRQCILSCSFLSKGEIEEEFEKIRNGEFVKGNIIQLFWILSSFMHACKGMHVVPIIYCKP